MNSGKGFTLVELMIVVALIGIVAGIAVPNYQTMMGSGRLTSASNTLAGALQFARSEAVTYSQNVSLCSSSNQTTCGGSWGDGAIVLHASGQVARVLAPFPEDIAIVGNTIQYDRNGRLGASTSLNVTNSYGARVVRITSLGKTSICKGTC